MICQLTTFDEPEATSLSVLMMEVCDSFSNNSCLSVTHMWYSGSPIHEIPGDGCDNDFICDAAH